MWSTNIVMYLAESWEQNLPEVPGEGRLGWWWGCSLDRWWRGRSWGQQLWGQSRSWCGLSATEGSQRCGGAAWLPGGGRPYWGSSVSSDTPVSRQTDHSYDSNSWKSTKIESIPRLSLKFDWSWLLCILTMNVYLERCQTINQTNLGPPRPCYICVLNKIFHMFKMMETKV